jgi:hypothetical protein
MRQSELNLFLPGTLETAEIDMPLLRSYSKDSTSKYLLYGQKSRCQKNRPDPAPPRTCFSLVKNSSPEIIPFSIRNTFVRVPY